MAQGSLSVIVSDAAYVPSSWVPPKDFDGYHLVRLLGQGGMGDVFLATDTFLERPVAVKFIRGVKLSASQRESFLAEARALARLQHPNVVSVYRVGEIDSHPYLVSEFVRGQTLSSLSIPMASGQLLELSLGLARGLAGAHRRGVLHRDLKPANALVSDDGEVKLVDFGLAQLVEPGAQASLATVEVFGTPAYLAPELWAREPASFRSDVYSLGAVMYELCVGHPPHLDGQIAEVIAEIAALGLDPVSQDNPNVDPRIAEVIDKCLHVDPARRYANGEEVYQALERLSSRGRSVALPEGNPYRGLQAFEAEHRALFFGREAETQILLERLRTDSFVLVTADSGVGKSSLCRAGVLPEVVNGALGEGREWKVVSFTPGQHPLDAAIAVLAPLLAVDEAELARRIREDASSIGRDLRKRLGRDGGLVIFVDQLEELSTLATTEESQVVGELLGWLTGSPGIRLLATVRSDFLVRVSAIAGIGNAVTRALFILKPLAAEGIRSAIVGPAAAKAVSFESEALIESLIGASTTEGGLPLLQFALAELWDKRDLQKQRITSAAMESIGGVVGALARHADGVLQALRPLQFAAARRLMPLLVTTEGTRARRSERELIAGDANAREVLEALVRARLLVAREGDEGSDYDVAHEALIRGWPTLKGWLEQDAERRAARERLTAAATEWERLGLRREALWSQSQIEEVAFIDPVGLAQKEAAFLVAARKEVSRGRTTRIASLIAAAMTLLALYGVMRVRAQGAVRTKVEAHALTAANNLTAARLARVEVEALRKEAFDQFDRGKDIEAERDWSRALARTSEVDELLSRATQALENAVSLDHERADLRKALGEALYERVSFADAAGRRELRDELRTRLSLFDADGEYQKKLSAPATLEIEVPAGAHATLVTPRGGEPSTRKDLGAAPIRPLELSPGTYSIEVWGLGLETVVLPMVLQRAEHHRVAITPPPASSVARGLVYIPQGRFLYGSNSDETLRRDFLNTTPLHSVTTRAYLIGENETTFGEYLAFLDALAPAERALRMPRVGSENERKSLVLKHSSTGWQLIYQPTQARLVATQGQPVRYAERNRLAEHDWQKFPVVGIDASDAAAYAAWLDRTGQVPGARLCSELEWERGAKGADGRQYPHGDSLAADSANFDEAYGKTPTAFGLDQVGSHPLSKSPFGLNDMAGNAFEWTTAAHSKELVARGGSFYFGRNSARSANREVIEPSLRDIGVGFRVCASAPSP